MLKHGLNDMIRHPVSESFVHLKWNKVRKFFYFGLGYRLAFAICMTVAVIFVYGHNRTIAEWNKTRFIHTSYRSEILTAGQGRIMSGARETQG